MKIIIGSESFAPNISGVATAAELLAKSLSEKGHEVYVISPSRTFTSFIDTSFAGFKVIRVKSIINPFRKGFRVSFFPHSVIFHQVQKIKPDIIHLQDPTSICSELLRTGRKFGIPVVVTNHFSLDYVISYLKWLRPVHRQIKFILRNYLSNFYNKCEFVTCPTETVKADLLTWGVKSPIIPISNGVDLDRFFAYSDISDIHHKYHLPPNPIVLYMGRVDKDKKIEVFISAIPLVLKEINAHFIVAGMGDEVPRMKKLADKLRVERAISWIGWLDKKSEDFEKIYQASTVFAIPSTIETQSIVTMEAMAAGKPIVGANAGALPELIKNGENGYLAKPDDAADLAQKIVKILSDKKLQESMGKRSIELVSEHEIRKSIDKILNIYEKCRAQEKK